MKHVARQKTLVRKMISQDRYSRRVSFIPNYPPIAQTHILRIFRIFHSVYKQCIAFTFDPLPPFDRQQSSTKK